MSATNQGRPTHVVNGIYVDDLLALIERVSRDPAKGRTNWRVTTTWQGQAGAARNREFRDRPEKTCRGRFSIDIDEPLQLGGSNNFAQSAGVI